jgi:hypothetical protein
MSTIRTVRATTKKIIQDQRDGNNLGMQSSNKDGNEKTYRSPRSAKNLFDEKKNDRGQSIDDIDS